MAFQAVNQKEIDAVIAKLQLVAKSVDKVAYEKVLAEAAKPAQVALQQTAPESKQRHVVRDDGGQMKTVRPGNLKRSIQIFKGKANRVARMVLVGPIVSKKSKVKSVAGAKRVSRAKRAFYWRFVNFGTMRQAPNRFIDKARSMSRGAVLAGLKKGIDKYLSKEIGKLFK